MKDKKSKKRVRKEAYYERIYNLFSQYQKAMLVDCNNISSKQIQNCRFDMRVLGATILMGKNSVILTALRERLREPVETDFDYERKKREWKPAPHWECLQEHLKGNVGLIFTNGNLLDLKEVMGRHVRGAAAKAGQIALSDVFIEPGSTGLDPKMTEFFQRLDIPTKISKGSIEIIAKTKVIEEGSVVGASQCSLLDKLNIAPFEYKLTGIKVIDNGEVYSTKVLEITPEDIIAKFQAGVRNIAAVSMEVGYPTEASIPHQIRNAFKNLVGVTFETDYSFPQAEDLKNAMSNAPAAAADDKPAEAAPVEEEKPKEEPEAADIGGIFDDDEEDY